MMTETLGLYDGGFGSTLQIFVLGHIKIILMSTYDVSNRTIEQKCDWEEKQIVNHVKS